MKSYIAINMADPSPERKPVENVNALAGKSNTTLARKWPSPLAIIHRTVTSIPIQSTTVNRPTAVIQNDHQRAYGKAHQTRLRRPHAAPEIAHILSEPDISRSDFQGTAEDEL